MELFEERTFELIEESPIKGLKEIIDAATKHLNNCTDTETTHEVLWHTCLLIDNVMQAYHLDLNVEELPEPNSSINITCNSLQRYLESVSKAVEIQVTHLNIEDIKRKYTQKLKSGFAYEFSQGDYDRIQILVNELRDYISKSDLIDEGHKHRLLKRLERLQSELHKRTADLDRFWGLVGDAGVVLGKFGTDVKPLVDRVKEITNIVWNTQKRAEELPSETPNPMLEATATDESL